MITNRKIKIAMIIAIIVLFAIAASTMGVSYAIWTSPDGSYGGGESTASPSVTPDSNNVWAKYFNGNIIELFDKDGNKIAGNWCEITTFYTDGAACQGLNLSDVYIPSIITKGETKYQVYRITNSIFADSTLKSLPVSIHIPTTVCEIDAAAFASLPNLETVYFENVNPCTIGEYAFAGCSKLTTVTIVNGTKELLKADQTAFIGTKVTL